MSVEDALIATLPTGALSPARAPVWTATGLERQIFLDHTGRRALGVRIAGACAALLSTGWLAALVTSSFGFATLPALPTPSAGLAPRGGLTAIHTRRRVLDVADVSGARRIARVDLDERVHG